MCKAGNILSDLAQGKSVWGYLYSNEEVLSVCEKVRISPGFFSIDAGAGKHTYLLQESGKTINVDAKIKTVKWYKLDRKSDIKKEIRFPFMVKSMLLTAVGISMFRQKMNLHQRKLNIQVVQYNRNYFKFQ